MIITHHDKQQLTAVDEAEREEEPRKTRASGDGPSLAARAREAGIKARTVEARILSGKSLQEALIAPVREYGNVGEEEAARRRDVLRQAVASFGGRQRELAKALGVSDASVSRWAKAARVIPKGRAKQLEEMANNSGE